MVRLGRWQLNLEEDEPVHLDRDKETTTMHLLQLVHHAMETIHQSDAWEQKHWRNA